MMKVKTNKLRFKILSVLLLSATLSSCDLFGGGSSKSAEVDETIDSVPPVISLNGSATVQVSQGGTFTDAGAIASDDVDGDISGSIIIAGDTVDTASVGSYTITYNVSDAAGNTAAQVSRTVNVNAVVSNGNMKFITYTVKDAVNTTEMIYTVRGNGSDHRELHTNIVSGGEITNHSWAPTVGDRIAYLGDVDIDTITELYSIDPDQNSRVKLNGLLVSGGDVVDYQWSPDGTKVAYRANQDDFGKIELYVVDSDGQNRVKVSTSLVGGGNVEEFFWSPTSSHLLYLADAVINDQFGYHVATNNGTSSIQINTSNTGIFSELLAIWSPMGNYISYTTDKGFIYKISDSSNTELPFNSSVIWSNSEKFVGARDGLGNFSVYDVQVDTSVDIALPSTSSSDSTRLVNFILGQETLVIVNRFSGIYRYSPVGVLIDNDNPGTQFLTPELIYSPDKQRVLVKDNFSSANTFLVAYDLNLGAAVQLPKVRGTSKTPTWSADSTRVLFYPDASFQAETLISPDGSGLVNLETSTSSLNTDDAQWVGNDVYLAGSDVVGSGSYEIIKTDKIGANLATIASSGSTHAFLSDTQSRDPDGPSFRLASDDSFLVYRRDSITPGEVDELHSVSADGTGDVQLNINLAPFVGLSITDYSIQP